MISYLFHLGRLDRIKLSHQMENTSINDIKTYITRLNGTGKRVDL